MPASELSVVIPAYNGWWLTERCLRELDRLRMHSSIAFETIVVDDASTDETPRAIAAFPWVRYHRNETNQYFSGTCNAGARLAEAPVILFLNNDAYPLGDAFAPLVRAFDRPEVAIASGGLFWEDGVTQAAGLVMLPNGHWHYSCRNLPSTLDDVTESRDAVGVSGAAMAVRAPWFRENGGFDESYLIGFEDVDLCMRAREQGLVTAYVADSRFAHYEAASDNRFAHELENERLFYERWRPKLAAFPKTLRGDVGAIAIRNGSSGNPLLEGALADLQSALRGFGHPLVRDRVALWRKHDRRFRRAATLGWFCDAQSPGIAIHRRNSGFPTIRTRGATEVSVPFLPCASAKRVETLGVYRSDDPDCKNVGVLGEYSELASHGGFSVTRLTHEVLLGPNRSPLACVVHLGLSDPAAYGNVLLAQAGIPAIVAAREEFATLFQPDVAFIASLGELVPEIARVLADPALRSSSGERLAADAKRRFSPRRSAIRVVDLLCAARFGLEGSATVAAAAGRLNR